MHDPIAASRRNIARAVVIQMAAVALVAAGCFLLKGSVWGLGVLAGGIGMAAGGGLSSRIALGGGVSPATGALARLILAMLAKWVVVLLVLVVAVAVAGWPPIAVLAGVIVALLAQVLALLGR